MYRCESDALETKVMYRYTNSGDRRLLLACYSELERWETACKQTSSAYS